MRYHRITCSLMVMTGLILTLWGCGGTGTSDVYVVILSMDGCRWDYPQMAEMPNLESIARRGVKAESLQPSFPTNTFPNHYSIATGLYPDHHGIVNNTFYDAQLDRMYKMSDRDAVEDGVFYGGEPIWVTAEQQGVTAASFFWVGSEAPVQGIRPSIWKRYDGSVPYEDRVDSVIAWLQLPPERRPHLIMWYFDQPDGSGHDYGPEGEETLEMLAYVDSLLGVFLSKLEQLPIADKVNVIVTSDHGMAATSEDRVVQLNDYINPDWLERNLWVMFDPQEGYADSVYLGLQKAPHLRVWKRDSIPDYLHYGTHPRVLDLVIALDDGWSVTVRPNPDLERYNGGSHGYDPTFKSMHTIFYAAGPAFKTGYVHPTFENVHIYSLIAEILNLDPAPTDGNLKTVAGMLK